MRKANWWPNCFENNGLCICGIEFGMNFDEKVFRYEPQIPKAFNTIDTVHIWKDRMRQWREIMFMEKQNQFQFHSETNSPLKVVGWESPKCWEDEPIIVWLKPSHYIRKKKTSKISSTTTCSCSGADVALWNSYAMFYADLPLLVPSWSL